MSLNTLYYGDNLNILRDHVQDASVDLIYLDPPFNSNASYNVLFRDPTGEQSQSQIEAFEDTWHWNDKAELAFDETVHNRYGNSDVANMIIALQGFLGRNDLMAYLAMMAVRLLELHRVLKETGSLYLHCDPTASHYLKIVLDAVFGTKNFRNEITWKRTSSHGSAKRWGPVHDTIFFYTKSDSFQWNRVKQVYNDEYIKKFYRFSDEIGRYQPVDLTGAGKRTGSSGKPWKGVDPTLKGRHWAVPVITLKRLGLNGEIQTMTTQEKLDFMEANNLIIWPKKGSVPRFKRYLNETDGVTVQDVITDIAALSSHAKERLGYPTQKPVALLERILAASSSEGDVVLDPFCGCGTTVHAAQKMGRRWLGIDITHLAIGLIRRRLIDAFPQAAFEVVGVPKDLEGARDLALRDKHQFQLWALSLIEAQAWKGGKKGGDGGIDGYLFFKPDGKTTEKAIVSVKGGVNIKPSEIRDLAGTLEKERAKMGFYLTLEDPSVRMMQEASSAGLYKTEYGSFAKIQILTIEDLMDGKKPHMPWIDPSVFKKAKREITQIQKELEV
jgi:DNA modification methylase